MRTSTWSNKTYERVELNIGDTVIDVYGDLGVFIVEDIDKNGWVWGSQMKKPYLDHNPNEKNFMDNNLAWKM